MLLYFLSEVPSNPVTVCQKLSVANPDQMSPAYFKQFFFFSQTATFTCLQFTSTYSNKVCTKSKLAF